MRLGVGCAGRLLGSELFRGGRGRLLGLREGVIGLLLRGLCLLGLPGQRLTGCVPCLLGQVPHGFGDRSRRVLGQLLGPLGHLFQADGLLRIRLLRGLLLVRGPRPARLGPFLVGPHLGEFRGRLERLGFLVLAGGPGLLRLRFLHLAAGLGHVGERLPRLLSLLSGLSGRLGQGIHRWLHRLGGSSRLGDFLFRFGHRLTGGGYPFSGLGGRVAERLRDLLCNSGDVLLRFSCGSQASGIVGLGGRIRRSTGGVGHLFLLGGGPLECLRSAIHLADLDGQLLPLRIGDGDRDLVPRPHQGLVGVGDGLGGVSLGIAERLGRLLRLRLGLGQPPGDGGRERLVVGRGSQRLRRLEFSRRRGPRISGHRRLGLLFLLGCGCRPIAGLLQRCEPLGQLLRRQVAVGPSVLVLEGGGEFAERAEDLAFRGVGLGLVGLENRRRGLGRRVLGLRHQRRCVRLPGHRSRKPLNHGLHLLLGRDQPLHIGIVERRLGDLLPHGLDLGNRRLHSLDGLLGIVAHDALGSLHRGQEALERRHHPGLGLGRRREIGRLEPQLGGLQAAADIADFQQAETVGSAVADCAAPVAHVGQIDLQPLAQSPHGPLPVESREDLRLAVIRGPRQIANGGHRPALHVDQATDLRRKVGDLQPAQQLVPLLGQPDDDPSHLLAHLAHLGRCRHAAVEQLDNSLHLALHEPVDVAAHGRDLGMDGRALESVLLELAELEVDDRCHEAGRLLLSPLLAIEARRVVGRPRGIGQHDQRRRGDQAADRDENESASRLCVPRLHGLPPTRSCSSIIDCSSWAACDSEAWRASSTPFSSVTVSSIGGLLAGCPGVVPR